MTSRTKHLYLTLVETSAPVTVSEELAGTIGVRLDSLYKLFKHLVRDGVVERRKIGRGRGKGRGNYAEFVLTGKPYEEPPRKLRCEAVIIHDERPSPRIERLDDDLRWRGLTGVLFGDPPIGRSALDGPRRPTHRVLA